ncbi:MAG: hypothetical protein IPP72_21565 [Chitinophagaceae bacterium]|nr:hypothetical protein [Chitinophagaceae bacterium]
MKMLVITSIKEDIRAVSRIMDKADIPVYSVSETIGHKTELHAYLPDNWFGKTNEGTHALFFFSFTEAVKATHAIELVKEFNRESGTKFPIRAFVLPVEQSSY